MASFFYSRGNGNAATNCSWFWPLTAVGGFLSLEAWLAAHEAAIGADGVLAVPGAAHRAPKLLALVLVCAARREDGKMSRSDVEKADVKTTRVKKIPTTVHRRGRPRLMRAHAGRFPTAPLCLQGKVCAAGFWRPRRSDEIGQEQYYRSNRRSKTKKGAGGGRSSGRNTSRSQLGSFIHSSGEAEFRAAAM